jgi:hypothetical protein
VTAKLACNLSDRLHFFYCYVLDTTFNQQLRRSTCSLISVHNRATASAVLVVDTFVRPRHAAAASKSAVLAVWFVLWSS